MKAKIFSLLLMAIVSLFSLSFQSCSDDDDESVIGTSYWNANDLKGHWVAIDNNQDYVFDFEDNGTFSIDYGMVGSYQYGKYQTVNSVYPQEIGVKFPNTGETLLAVWTIEWLTPDKSEMQLSTYRLKKVK